MVSIMNLNAQSDRFFKYRDEYSRENDQNWCEFVLLPQVHGINYNYPADEVPVSDGVFLLMEMGLLYGMIRKCKKTDY